MENGRSMWRALCAPLAHTGAPFPFLAAADGPLQRVAGASACVGAARLRFCDHPRRNGLVYSGQVWVHPPVQQRSGVLHGVAHHAPGAHQTACQERQLLQHTHSPGQAQRWRRGGGTRAILRGRGHGARKRSPEGREVCRVGRPKMTRPRTHRGKHVLSQHLAHPLCRPPCRAMSAVPVSTSTATPRGAPAVQPSAHAR